MVHFLLNLLKMIEIWHSILIQNADRMPTEFCSKNHLSLSKKGVDFMIGRSALIIIRLITFLTVFCIHPIAFAEERYTVKSGDTLYSISKSFGVSIENLRETNHLNGGAIRPKQVLLIPNVAEKQREKNSKKHLSEMEPYVVKKGDTLYGLSTGAGVSMDEMKRINRLQSSVLRIGQNLILPKTEVDMEEIPEDRNVSERTGSEQGGEGNGNGNNHENSEPLGKWNNPWERSLFVKVVKNFLGTPYRLGGSTLKGIDCSAFVKKVYEIFDISLPRTAREQFSIGRKLEKSQLEEGDLVFFKRRGNNAHVGIYIGDNQFVHASSSSKEIKIDCLETPYYSQRFLRGVRIKELESGSPLL